MTVREILAEASSFKFELALITSSNPNHDTPPNISLLRIGVSTSSGKPQPVGQSLTFLDLATPDLSFRTIQFQPESATSGKAGGLICEPLKAVVEP